MGAWALTLFSCDYDLNLVAEFDDQAGLTELELAAGGKDRSKTSPAEQRQADLERIRRGEDMQGYTVHSFPRPPHACDDEIRYSLYAKLCSDPEKVRQYLDSGVIGRMMDQYGRELVEANKFWQTDAYGPGYQLIILGCCAMTLGAHLSQQDRDLMQAHCGSVHLMRHAVKQVQAALDPDEGYVNGVPWDFMTTSLDTADDEDLLFPGTGLSNCMAPDHGRVPTEMAAWREACTGLIAQGGIHREGMTAAQIAKTKANLAFNPCKGQDKEPVASQKAAGYMRYFPDGLCSFCGCRKGEDSEALLVCSRCKSQRYCGKDCQKMAWRYHKKECRVSKA
ncbi:unnamed protein product [Zymoseptoria tritici ST99CH_1A5]|uniref:MYND-type domain-containing protein n=1 Tax=Zymoseptoria tritici ST99CH_1A5 TaxID=1276529 RepID=A0A1Y6LCT9_ZYMTR|nr:unnamed protein product [Zymoseptoria tritici ST99CH_3D1]SMY22253.1 unnamed protein product [Zymoseptoria tritici ST99CH_1A5]